MRLTQQSYITATQTDVTITAVDGVKRYIETASFPFYLGKKLAAVYNSSIISDAVIGLDSVGYYIETFVPLNAGNVVSVFSPISGAKAHDLPTLQDVYDNFRSTGNTLTDTEGGKPSINSGGKIGMLTPNDRDKLYSLPLRIKRENVEIGTAFTNISAIPYATSCEAKIVTPTGMLYLTLYYSGTSGIQAVVNANTISEPITITFQSEYYENGGDYFVTFQAKSDAAVSVQIEYTIPDITSLKRPTDETPALSYLQLGGDGNTEVAIVPEIVSINSTEIKNFGTGSGGGSAWTVAEVNGNIPEPLPFTFYLITLAADASTTMPVNDTTEDEYMFTVVDGANLGHRFTVTNGADTYVLSKNYDYIKLKGDAAASWKVTEYTLDSLRFEYLNANLTLTHYPTNKTVIAFNTDSGNKTLSLLPPRNVIKEGGIRFTVMRIGGGTNTLTVTRADGGGIGQQTSFVLQFENDSIDIVEYGGYYYVVDNRTKSHNDIPNRDALGAHPATSVTFGNSTVAAALGHMVSPLNLATDPTYNIDGTIKIVKYSYKHDPALFYEERFEYDPTSFAVSKMEVKNDLNGEFKQYTNLYSGGQLVMPTITIITDWSII